MTRHPLVVGVVLLLLGAAVSAGSVAFTGFVDQQRRNAATDARAEAEGLAERERRAFEQQALAKANIEIKQSMTTVIDVAREHESEIGDLKAGHAETGARVSVLEREVMIIRQRRER